MTVDTVSTRISIVYGANLFGFAVVSNPLILFC